MRSLRPADGFTLIELLVVISIMGITMSLVAPLMVEQAEKAKGTAEYLEVEQYLNDSTKVAFLRGQPMRIELAGKELKRYLGDDVTALQFERLFFPKQQIHISANGFVDQKDIEVVTGKKTQSLSIEDGR